jgi:hypothetical protein
MAVGAKKKKGHLKRTPKVIKYIRERALTKSDKEIALGLRRLTGESRWSKSRVYHIRRELAISKGRDFSPNKRDPIGTISTHERAGYPPYRRIKIAEGKRISYGRYVWEQANGPAPKGHRVVHLDNDQMNCDLSNLKLMTNEEACKYIPRFFDYSFAWREKVGDAVRDAKEHGRRKKAAETYLTHKPYEFSR